MTSERPDPQEGDVWQSRRSKRRVLVLATPDLKAHNERVRVELLTTAEGRPPLKKVVTTVLVRNWHAAFTLAERANP